MKIPRKIKKAARHITRFEQRQRDGISKTVFFRVNEGYPNTKWTSTKKQLPQHCEIVLIALFNVKTENYGYYVGWYNQETKEWYLADYGYAYNVLYWMPIPQPPKFDI